MNQDNDKPFGEQTAEKAAEGILTEFTQIIKDYREQYGFTITGVETSYFDFHGERTYIPHLILKR
jgi:hypothetical protein